MLVFVHECHSALDIVLSLGQIAHVLINDVVYLVSAFALGIGIKCELHLALGIGSDGTLHVFGISLEYGTIGIFFHFLHLSFLWLGSRDGPA